MFCHSCNGTNIFIRWKMKCTIQLGFASLNGTFHISPYENICTISLINIHVHISQILILSDNIKISLVRLIFSLPVRFRILQQYRSAIILLAVQHIMRDICSKMRLDVYGGNTYRNNVKLYNYVNARYQSCFFFFFFFYFFFLSFFFFFFFF